MRRRHAVFHSITAISLALSAILAGCAHYVAVRHLVPPRNLPVGEIGQLSTLVLTMRLEPAGKPAGILGRAAMDFLKEASEPDSQASVPVPRRTAYSLLAACARAMDSPFSRVKCTLVDGPFATVFMDSLRPSAVLVLEPSRISASQRGFEVKEKGGARRTYWQLKAEFSVAYRLLSWPDRRELASGRFSRQADGTEAEKTHLESWMQKVDFGENISTELRNDLLPTPVERYRRLHKGKSDEMKRAGKLARKGDWDGAAALWQDQSGPDGPGASWNLGLYFERQGGWEKARASYARARETSAKRRDRTVLGQYMDELDRALVPRAFVPDESPDWFDRPVAVLLPSNHSNDVEAPERIRRLAWTELRGKGYNVLPLDKVSAALREIGITQGGQINAFPISQIARTLNGARLLTGDIESFKTVNVGLYNLRSVSVNFILYGPDGSVLMESVGHGYREILVDPKETGRSFLFGLAETAVTKAARVHLEEESRTATATGLEVLPARRSGP